MRIGFLTSELEDELNAMPMAQLKALAKEYGVPAQPEGLLDKMTGMTGKAFIVYKLKQQVDLNLKTLRKWRESVAKATTDDPPRKPVKVPAIAETPATPTIASHKTEAMISFDEVVGYLESYRFISRYNEELHYELELAGALREHFGQIMRQYPVPGPAGRKQSIDLHLGDVGIELKYDLKTQPDFDRAKSQLMHYNEHYRQKLVLLLIATHGREAEIHDLRKLAHVIEK